MKYFRIARVVSQFNIKENSLSPTFTQGTLQSIKNASMKYLGESALDFDLDSPSQDLLHHICVSFYKSGGV